MRKTLVVVGATLTALAMTAGLAQAAAEWRVVKSARSSGDYAVVTASASVNKPGAIGVRVLTVPRQPVDVNWSITCSRGTGAGSKSGRAVGRAPLTRTVRFPMARPDWCSIGVTGALTSGGGRITVQILRR